MPPSTRPRTWFDDGELLADLRPPRRDSHREPEPGARRRARALPPRRRSGRRSSDWASAGRSGRTRRRRAVRCCSRERIEDPALPTVLGYGHGDVVAGHDGQWRDGRSPWALTRAAGAGTGAAPRTTRASTRSTSRRSGRVLAARGRLGFNAKLLLEMGEEVGSPGLRAVCEARADVAARRRADRLRRPAAALGPADDLPRLARRAQLRSRRRPARGRPPLGQLGRAARQPRDVLAQRHRVAGRRARPIRVHALRPAPHPRSVRRALADIEPGEPDGPAIDADWGEPGLTPAERVFGWNALEVLAFRTGNPERAGERDPAARERASASCASSPAATGGRSCPRCARHLDRAAASRGSRSRQARCRARWRRRGSIRTTRGCAGPRRRSRRPPARDRRSCRTSAGRCPTTASPRRSACRRSGCRIPMPACSQHAPDEHLLAPSRARALRIMTGLFWDLGVPGSAPVRQGGSTDRREKAVQCACVERVRPQRARRDGIRRPRARRLSPTAVDGAPLADSRTSVGSCRNRSAIDGDA